MTKHRIYSISVASVYPHYVAKAEKKDARRQRSTKSLFPPATRQCRTMIQLSRCLFFICRRDWWRYCRRNGSRPRNIVLESNGFRGPHAIRSRSGLWESALVWELFCWKKMAAGWRSGSNGHSIGFRLSAFGFRLPAFGFRLSAFGLRLSK